MQLVLYNTCQQSTLMKVVCCYHSCSVLVSYLLNSCYLNCGANLDAFMHALDYNVQDLKAYCSCSLGDAFVNLSD